MPTKPHLVLVHSFPTNSVLLHGLEEFLADFFTVHFIDLPGFHIQSPPLTGKITIKKFSNFLDQKISELDIDEYIVGGVSFGFLVANTAKLDKRCRAILAMEPYVNTRCLSLSLMQRISYQALVRVLKIIHSFGLEKRIWNSETFNKYLQGISDYPKERVSVIIKHLDPRTFFSVAGILTSYWEEPVFHKLPYFLIGNFADKTINFQKTADVFISHLSEVHIASEPIDHYPKELTKAYFKTRIPKEHIQRLLACVEGG